MAVTLRLADRAGVPLEPLRGKHVGLLCIDQDSGDAGLFRSAAEALGARVARLPHSAVLAGTDPASRICRACRAARWLGQLYEAIECQAMSIREVDCVRLWARLPVFDNLAGLAAISPLPEALSALCDDEAQARCCLLRGMLVSQLR